MGTGASNPIAGALVKQQMNSTLGDAQSGMQSTQKTEEQKKQEQERANRAKNRVTEFEQKKKDREERKKKLKSQWGAHRQANS
eukprot:scaffold12328_cov86-Cylindrotheca_fusiformis.AAC.3